VKYAAIIVVPVTTLVMALSQPAISTLFQDRYAQAPFFLVLLSVSYLYAAFGSLSTGNLIIGQGYAGYSMKLSVLTAVIGLPLSFLLIFKFGVTGLIVTNLVSGLPSIFLGLRFIKKQFGVTVDWASSAKILFSSALAAVLTFILLSLLPFSSPVKLLIGVVFFVVVIVPTIIFSRTLKKPDIIILRGIIGGLGSLRRIILPILNLLEKLVNLIQGQ
jgi:O-antigen/teichoic acid export membrane protein